MMKFNANTRTFFVIFISFLVSSCKPEVTADLYTRDLADVLTKSSIIEVPVRIKVPIVTASKCDEDRPKIMPALEEYGYEARFISCEKSEHPYDFLISEMKVQIVSTLDYDFKGLFGVSVTHTKRDYAEFCDTDVYFHLTSNLNKAIEQIDNQYTFQSVQLDDALISIKLNNDMSDGQRVCFNSSFINGNPIDEIAGYKLNRRDVREIIPSDVKSKVLILKGNAKIFSLFTSST